MSCTRALDLVVGDLVVGLGAHLEAGAPGVIILIDTGLSVNGNVVGDCSSAAGGIETLALVQAGNGAKASNREGGIDLGVVYERNTGIN